MCVCVDTHTRTHPFFIHSSINGHLGCFCVLAVVNNVAVNIGMNVSFEFELLSFLDTSPICPGMGLLDHMVALFLVFEGTPIVCIYFKSVLPGTC